jgi:hypothetical protein
MIPMLAALSIGHERIIAGAILAAAAYVGLVGLLAWWRTR